MKKRLKGLLALTLALCMVLTMGVGMASAASPDPVAVNNVSSQIIVENDTIMYNSGSGGRLLVRYDGVYEIPGEGDSRGSDLYIGVPTDAEGSSDSFSALKQNYTYFITSDISGPKVKEVNEPGYVSNKWKLKSPSADPCPETDEDYCWRDSEDGKYWLINFGTGDNENPHTGNLVLDEQGAGVLELASLTKLPIAYNIKYVDEAGNPLKTAGVYFAKAEEEDFNDNGDGSEVLPKSLSQAGKIATEADLKEAGDDTKVGKTLVWEAEIPKFDENGNPVKQNDKLVVAEYKDIEAGASIEAIYSQLAECGEVLKNISVEGINSLSSDAKVYEKNYDEEQEEYVNTTAIAWVKQNIILKAQWKYGIIYEGAGGTTADDETMSQVLFDHQEYPDAFAANMFTYEGKTFVEWNTQADGKGKSFAAGTDIPEDIKNDIDNNGSITLYAIWKDNTEGTTPENQTEQPTSTQPPTTATADADEQAGTEKADKTDKADKAEKPENDGATDTGDSFSIMPWLILATVAAIGTVAITSRKRTER